MLQRLRGIRGKRDASDHNASTFLIVGLGNPGRRYEATRHNAGFMVVDRLHDILSAGTIRSRFQASLAETSAGGKRVVLVKPETFMNESGIAVGQAARWYRVPIERILIIYDDLDLPFGTIRLRPGGSAGGHNGVESVIAHLRSDSFPRLRVGISRPRSGSTVPYVLSRFSRDEERQLPDIVQRSADAAIAWLHEGIHAAMNTYNRRDSDNPRRDSPRPMSAGSPDSV